MTHVRGWSQLAERKMVKMEGMSRTAIWCNMVYLISVFILDKLTPINEGLLWGCIISEFITIEISQEIQHVIYEIKVTHFV